MLIFSPFLPQGLNVQVWRKYEEFIAELSARFPHEKEGIKKFYDECWRVFNRWGAAVEVRLLARRGVCWGRARWRTAQLSAVHGTAVARQPGTRLQL